MNPEDFFTFANSNHNTRGHASTNSCLATAVLCAQRVFFTERVVKPWNCLPAELHHFSSCLFLSLSFTVLICLILYRVNLLSLVFQWPILALCLNYIIVGVS